MKSISQDTQIRRVNGAEAAGTSTITSASVDARPFDAVTFIVTLGAMVSGSVVTLKVEGRAEYDSGSWITLDGSASFTSDGTDDRQLVLEVRRPVWGELRAVVERETENAEIESIICICAAPQDRPAAIGDDVEDRKLILGGEEA